MVAARLLGNARQRIRRGGIKKWESVRGGILNHLKQDRGVLVTTMVDYYGLPHTWPGRAKAASLPFPNCATAVERELFNNVRRQLGSSPASDRFMPYVVMHEFEGLLFSDPDGFGRGIGRRDLAPQIRAIREEYGTPEEINDSPDTAPSKRIRDLVQGYQKPFQGLLAVREIGLDAIRQECPMFSRWIERLEKLGG